jgi:acyl-CoA reductase-like NAD-dependent aldehyde dehydrogenase
MLHDHDLVSVQEVRSKVEQAYAAWQTYRNYTQAQVDAVVEAIGAKGRAHARQLAEMAVQETGYGNVEDKIAKNLLNADLLIRYLRPMKTVGVLREIPEEKVIEIGVPVGVVAAILPTTNPTSTAIYKAAVSLKAGNAVVFSPHPRAKACTCATAALLVEAAQEAGAPPGIIQCINNSTLEGTNALMRHPKTGAILATGGSGMVRAAYTSGKPAFGVGPGNVPVLLDDSYDADEGVRQVVAGKSFDYGTVCSSEQTLVASRARRDEVLAALRKHGAYIMDDPQRTAVEKTLFSHGTTVRAECVGQSPQRIAGLAGFTVPSDVRILVAEIQGVGKEHPLSAEKLSPVLALLFTDGFEASVKACEGIVNFGGLGHTTVIFSHDEARIREYGLRIPAFRVLVNTPAPQGSVGITTNLQPSMTLGCGAMGGNSTSDNVGPQHLINIKRIAWAVRRPEEAFDASAPASAGTSHASAPAAVERDRIVEAVEKYLAQRGVPVAKSAPPVPAAAPRSTARGVVESVVDRFLASRQAPAPVCACPAPAAAAAPAASAPKAATPPAPAVTIVDFVCESDVRTAIAQGKKIYIGPRTIVTPAAREAAGPDDDVLVRAER